MRLAETGWAKYQISFHPDLVGAGDAVLLAAVVHPGLLPGAAVALLVGVAGQQRDQRHQVEAAEDADADHELLQLLLVALVVLDDLPHVVERDDAGQDEGEAHGHADAQRRQDEVAQGVQVVQAHEAHAADVVALHLVEGQQHDRQRPGDPPGCRVEPHLGTDAKIKTFHCV